MFVFSCRVVQALFRARPERRGAGGDHRAAVGSGDGPAAEVAGRARASEGSGDVSSGRSRGQSINRRSEWIKSYRGCDVLKSLKMHNCMHVLIFWATYAALKKIRLTALVS